MDNNDIIDLIIGGCIGASIIPTILAIYHWRIFIKLLRK